MKVISEQVEIIEKIIAKGGLYADVAAQVIESGYDANQFLIECYKQCDSKSLRLFWGKEIINLIIIYNVRHNGKLMIDLM